MNPAIAVEISELIENKKNTFIGVSDQVWEYAEIRFEEFLSAELLCRTLEEEGFQVEREAGGLATGFIGSYGSGAPVIAILGEFDALTSLSQQAGEAAENPVVPGANGHGCGHNLLGAGSLAAAVAVKDYMQRHGLSGTVRYYGCPAEESGSGKAFMARAGLFDDVDAAFCWHPATVNAVAHLSTLANLHVQFTYKGISAHAAAAPHLGRSALDAVELMNVGSNYLREHIIDQARIHYAITNSGGLAPNVVQAEAEVDYLIRAPKASQVLELFERVKDVARGAALMTGTTMTYRIEGGASNLIPNASLERVMHGFMKELELPRYSEEDVAYAAAIFETIPAADKQSAAMQVGKEAAAMLERRPLASFVAPYQERLMVMPASSDVGDVSWNVPTAQCGTVTWAYATPLHAWQTVAQGKSSYAHQGMLLAGKTIACTAIAALTDADLIASAKAELKERLAGESYVCPIPADVNPPKKG
ncbi:aminobenzoyl-glutamate utilization protein B [Paenibacillus phyllosphaerae]|uniref:Aminobenzoyl-glutamate utilization protein B n=1 Tax=Paenibacillus phyllosphaerae TaxID=274593 RepID=A0A7W5B0G1_9BACL|nr:M20 family metallopeptidase [Paenibacillus phyllosphaerae]MBB3111411.1 aminobenzoyl-glutamate utilization protein B [Paenibacillus phyllosphaerae]